MSAARRPTAADVGAGTPVFELDGLRFRYPGAARPALAGVTARVPPAGIYAVLGPNGSGKSTLARLLLGALRPAAGTVRFAGRDITRWRRRPLARRIGVVPQVEELAFPLSVRELVAMGRYPHLGPWRREGAGDHRAIVDAMDRCDVLRFADRPISTLSGGERQRARVARALAQQPGTMVLDEPTASLDIRHEMAIFELLHGLTARDGVTIVLITHNINLAARFATRLLLLAGGRPAVEGPPDEVLTRDVLERVYGWPVTLTSHPGPGPDAGAPQVVPLADSQAGPVGADERDRTGADR